MANIIEVVGTSVLASAVTGFILVGIDTIKHRRRMRDIERRERDARECIIRDLSKIGGGDRDVVPIAQIELAKQPTIIGERSIVEKLQHDILDLVSKDSHLEAGWNTDFCKVCGLHKGLCKCKELRT